MACETKAVMWPTFCPALLKIRGRNCLQIDLEVTISRIQRKKCLTVSRIPCGHLPSANTICLNPQDCNSLVPTMKSLTATCSTREHPVPITWHIWATIVILWSSASMVPVILATIHTKLSSFSDATDRSHVYISTDSMRVPTSVHKQ